MPGAEPLGDRGRRRPGAAAPGGPPPPRVGHGQARSPVQARSRHAGGALRADRHDPSLNERPHGGGGAGKATLSRWAGMRIAELSPDVVRSVIRRTPAIAGTGTTARRRESAGVGATGVRAARALVDPAPDARTRRARGRRGAIVVPCRRQGRRQAYPVLIHLLREAPEAARVALGGWPGAASLGPARLRPPGRGSGSPTPAPPCGTST